MAIYKLANVEMIEGPRTGLTSIAAEITYQQDARYSPTTIQRLTFDTKASTAEQLAKEVEDAARTYILEHSKQDNVREEAASLLEGMEITAVADVEIKAIEAELIQTEVISK